MLSLAHHLDDATVGTTAAGAGARVDGTVVLAPRALAPCHDQRGARPAQDQVAIDAISSRSMAMATVKVRTTVPVIDATPWLMGTFGTYHPTWRLRLHAP